MAATCRTPHLAEPTARPPRRRPVEHPLGADLDLRHRLALQVVDDDAVEQGQARPHDGAQDVAIQARHLHVRAEAKRAGTRKDPRPAVSAVRMRPVQARVKAGGAHVEEVRERLEAPQVVVPRGC